MAPPTGDNGRKGDASGLGAVEIAYLAGGVPRALDAGVAELMAGGALRWEGERAVRGEQPAPPGLLGDIHTLVVNSQGYAGLQTAARRAGWPLQALQRTLERRGLLLDPDAERRARLLPTLLPLGVALLGVAKLVVGVARAKPIGGLLLLVIVTLFAAWRFAAGRVARSRAGDRALAQLRQRHARHPRAPGTGSGPGGRAGRDSSARRDGVCRLSRRALAGVRLRWQLVRQQLRLQLRQRRQLQQRLRRLRRWRLSRALPAQRRPPRFSARPRRDAG